MTGPAEAMAWVRIGAGGGANGTAWVPLAVMAGLALAALSLGGAAIAGVLVALAWLLGSVAVLVVAVAVSVVVVRRRREAWKPYGTDSLITTGPTTVADHICSVCAPVRVAAIALVLGPGGQVLGLCRAHVRAADLITNRAITGGKS